MTLHRHLSDGTLQVLIRYPVLGRIGRGELCKGPWSGHIRIPKPDQGPDVGGLHVRQSPETRVLELFHAQGKADVIGPGCDRVHGSAERFGPAGTEILRPRHGYEREPQVHGQGQSALAHADLLIARGQPRSLNLVSVNACVFHTLDERLHHQLFGAHVPSLSKATAPHADNRHLISDSRGHSSPPTSWSNGVME